MKTAIAIAAHPDDIEFMMAGTLLLLKKAGYEIHYMNLSRGNLGSVMHDAQAISSIRLEEAKKSASVLGAYFHPPICNDLEIIYNVENIRRISAIIRHIRPTIVLTHSPADYMEDHMITCRIVVTAAFAKGMTNFKTIPETEAGNFDCTIYHALPHTLNDQLRKKIIPGAFVNTTSVQNVKMEALKAHESQQSWLDVSQKLNSYLQSMENISLTVGNLSGSFMHAEGWRRHLHVGYCGPDDDPLKELSEDYKINEGYEKELNSDF
ncbi:MAG: PIG-L deacetylase family protein [Flavisolibacter sp.]